VKRGGDGKKSSCTFLIDKIKERKCLVNKTHLLLHDNPKDARKAHSPVNSN